MTNLERKTHCRELYEEYKILSHKTQLTAETYNPSRNLKVHESNLEALLKKEAIRKQLLEKCYSFLQKELSPEELFEIENG